MHRAVGPDFVLNVGDILYFTGLVKEFGKFCAENGLEVVTSEYDPNQAAQSTLDDEINDGNVGEKKVRFSPSIVDEIESKQKVDRVGPTSGGMVIDIDVMQTNKRRLSILGPETDKLQSINKMTGESYYISQSLMSHECTSLH